MAEVELQNGLLGEKVNIALVQLESPFNEELCHNDDTGLFSWIKKNKRKKKIITILDNIIKNFSSKPQLFPDVIVFPEYSVPFDMLPELEEYSKYYKIIIAGSDQVRDPNNEMFKKNVCPVIIQGKETTFIEKNSLYGDEKGVVDEGKVDRCHLDLYWNSGKETICLQVFICLDFLDHHNLVDKRKKGGIVVLMCSESMKEYACLHYLDMRFGKYLAFCNAVSLNDKKPVIIGKSAIYGSDKERDKNDAIVSIDGSLEAVIFARLNFTTPYYQTPSQIPTVNPVERRAKYRITSDFNFEIITDPLPISKKIAIINPALYYRTQLRLLKFVILKTEKYNVTRDKIKSLGEKADFDSFGVFGDHDTVSMSFLSAEDVRDLQKNMRNYIENDGMSIIEVTKIIKFYKYICDPKMLPKGLGNLLRNPMVYKKLVLLSKDWDTSLVSDEEKREFIENRLILGDYEVINPKNSEFIRCFVRIDLRKPTTDIATLFENQIVRNYISKLDTVLSIYETTGAKGFRCDYLIDIIDKPHSIFDIILKMHSKSEEFNINFNSNTFVVVEQLSRGMFDKLPLKEEFKEDLFELSIKELIKKDESQKLEFKSSLRWDYNKKGVNKDLELVIIKTISAFMNTNGGVLLIGVDPDKNILGLDNDFITLKDKNKDGFERQLTSLFNSEIGREFRNDVSITFEDFNDRTICKVMVFKRASEPIFLGNKKEFWIRLGSSTSMLNTLEAKKYIDKHWKK